MQQQRGQGEGGVNSIFGNESACSHCTRCSLSSGGGPPASPAPRAKSQPSKQRRQRRAATPAEAPNALRTAPPREDLRPNLQPPVQPLTCKGKGKRVYQNHGMHPLRCPHRMRGRWSHYKINGIQTPNPVPGSTKVTCKARDGVGLGME